MVSAGSGLLVGSWLGLAFASTPALYTFDIFICTCAFYPLPKLIIRLVDSGSVNVLANDIRVNFCNRIMTENRSNWNVYSNTEPVWYLVISVLVTWKWPLRPSRSFKITDFGTNWKLICDFLLVINTNLPPILHRFQDIADYWSHFFAIDRRVFTLTPSLGWSPANIRIIFISPETRVIVLHDT